MGILDRLGSVIKSYINDDSDRLFGKNSAKKRSDPDLNAAYEELDDFLRGKEAPSSFAGKSERETEKQKKARPVPLEIRLDFAELGLTPDATAEECKEAYKKLLKIHHPDHHAKHDENMKKATDKAARVNAAYDRLVIWFRVQNQV
jgi:DnaJ-domain-containing protein 1